MPSSPVSSSRSTAGGPAVAAPGQKASTFVPLESGTYAMVCNIPDAKGVPHVQKGMIKPLTVTDSEAASTDAPAADDHPPAWAGMTCCLVWVAVRFESLCGTSRRGACLPRAYSTSNSAIIPSATCGWALAGSARKHSSP